MKRISGRSFVIYLLCVLAITGTSCEKDENGNPSCETVVNAQGPAFIKVINEYNATVLVYLGDWIPFGAEIRRGACEIYGIPAESGNVEISTLDGSQTRDVFVDAQSGETTTITVGTDFF